jgi:small redox-active disulfide protein 2
MKIEVLGTGCSKCVALEASVKEAIAKSGKFVEFKKVEDIMEIMAYQVVSTPALVVDSVVVSTGKILSAEEVLKYINKEV